MSSIVKIKGACGLEIPCKIWKQGGSAKCKKRGWSIVSYPQPTNIQLMQDIIELCDGCPSIQETKKRTP